jgi:hypothetical protein
MLRTRLIIMSLAVPALVSASGAGDLALAEASLDTVHEIDAALRACWVPPADVAQDKIQVTVRLSFKRNGEILGEPLIAYEAPGVAEGEREMIRMAVAAALQRCNPLPLSAALGDIIAGHPINVRLGEGWRRKGKEPHSP